MSNKSDKSKEMGLIGGIEKRDIIIVDYDPLWPDKFQEQANNIAAALKHAALSIEHIGSTSVPGLAAKPVIDILLLVEDSADEVNYLPQLQAAGFELRVREPDWHEHRMFRTPGRDVHIHVFSADSSEVERHLTFRDRLRSNAADRQLYEQRRSEVWPPNHGQVWTPMQGLRPR